MKPRDSQLKLREFQNALSAYETQLLRYVTRILSDSERAQDVVQEAYTKLWQQDFQVLRGQIRPWLFTVCRNRAFDICRKEKNMKPYSQSDAASKEILDSEAGAQEKLEKNESEIKVQTLIKDLPANQQEVIRLKFQCGLSYREIAKVTELSESNIGYLIHV